MRSRKYKPLKFHSPRFLRMIILAYGGEKYAGQQMHPLFYILYCLGIVHCPLGGGAENSEGMTNRERHALTSQFCIKTEMAPTTALRGGNISEDSLAISTAILAVAYAVCQPESLPPLVPPSVDVPRMLRDGEPMGRAMEEDETAGTLDFLLNASFRTMLAGNVRAEAETSPDDLDLRRRRITGAGETKQLGASRLTGSVTLTGV